MFNATTYDSMYERRGEKKTEEAVRWLDGIWRGKTDFYKCGLRMELVERELLNEILAISALFWVDNLHKRLIFINRLIFYCRTLDYVEIGPWVGAHLSRAARTYSHVVYEGLNSSCARQ
jgi:hypothetical protein